MNSLILVYDKTLFVMSFILNLLPLSQKNNLKEACEKEDVSSVQSILSRCPELVNEYLDDFYGTALIISASIGSEEIVNYLLSLRDLQINKTNQFGDAAIHGAASNGHRHCLLLLQSHPLTDINLQNKGGFTPLHCAASHGHTECLSLLMMNADIDPNIQTKVGDTALHCASSNGKLECVKLLLMDSTKVDSTIKNKRGKTARDLCCATYTEEDRSSLQMNILQIFDHRYRQLPIAFAKIVSPFPLSSNTVDQVQQNFNACTIAEEVTQTEVRAISTLEEILIRLQLPLPIQIAYLRLHLLICQKQLNFAWQQRDLVQRKEVFTKQEPLTRLYQEKTALLTKPLPDFLNHPELDILSLGQHLQKMLETYYEVLFRDNTTSEEVLEGVQAMIEEIQSLIIIEEKEKKEEEEERK